MAGRDVGNTLRNREACSICLEPFRGRDPKILPCFHTFCLPCLLQMAEKAKLLFLLSANTNPFTRKARDEEVFITCPTCRKDIPVPAEGVTKFQTNFYLDPGDQGHVQPIICDLCDQGQVASHCCTKCQMKLCFHCHRDHMPCPVPTASKADNPSVDKEEEETARLLKAGKAQMEVISQVLRHTAEEEKELHKQRKALEDDLHDLYTSGLARLADARDDILRSIRVHTENQTGKIKSETENLQEKYDALARSASQGDTSSVTAADLKTVLMSDSELEKMQTTVKQKPVQFFRLQAVDKGAAKNLKELVFGALELTPATQDVALDPADDGDVDSFQLFGDGSLQPPPQARQHIQVEHASDHDLAARMDELARKFEFTLNKVRENESQEKRLKIEVRNLREEVKGFGDKNALLMNDMATVQAENEKLRADLSQLQRGQQNRSQDRAGTDQQNRGGAPNTADHPEGAGSQEVTSSTTGHAGIESKAEAAAQQSSSETSRQIEHLQRDVRLLQDSQKNTADDKRIMQQLQREVRTLQISMENTADRTRVRELELMIERATVPIYFRAELDRKVTTSSQRPLICKDVLENKGGGYNSHTGMFYAPVSGTYLFLVTIAPFHEDKGAELDIVHENRRMGYVACDSIDSTSSATCVVEMAAGEKVWLETFPNSSSFGKDGVTAFSGVLLKPGSKSGDVDESGPEDHLGFFDYSFLN